MKAELLAPAGNYQKFKTALQYGADAVYLGGKAFSLRTFADNFSEEELKNAVTFAHSLGKKVYVTVNVFAKNEDFSLLSEYIAYLYSIGVDAIIASDPGVIYLAKKIAPNLCVHLSTQANTTNRYSVKFWLEQGVSRIVLARELSLREISEIRQFVPEMELEAFVHGAMCISYSGRCLLSDYLDGRQSNRGACVQACRWKYEIRALDNSKEGNYLTLEEDDRGAYILNSKDLNMIAHLEEMQKAGVDSFKIEGRMKSEYYLATVIHAYRMAIDGAPLSMAQDELQAVAHRDYTTAYTLGENRETVNYTNSQSKGDYTFIANVLSSEGGFVQAEMRNRFKIGDELEILSPSENFKKVFTVKKILDSLGQEVDDAKLVQEKYQIECPYPLKEGDFLRRKSV